MSKFSLDDFSEDVVDTTATIVDANTDTTPKTSDTTVNNNEEVLDNVADVDSSVTEIPTEKKSRKELRKAKEAKEKVVKEKASKEKKERVRRRDKKVADTTAEVKSVEAEDAQPSVDDTLKKVRKSKQPIEPQGVLSEGEVDTISDDSGEFVVKQQTKTVRKSKDKKKKIDLDAQGNVKRFNPKYLVYGFVGVIALIALFLIVKVTKDRDDTSINFVTVMNHFATQRTGVIDYTVDVNTAPLEGTDTTNDFSAWTTSDGLTVMDWTYPNYQVHITGYIANNAPYQGDIQIYLATSNYNDLLTEILTDGDTIYIDVAQMRDWCANSGDYYLTNLGNSFEFSSKYAQINMEDFYYPSGYAETVNAKLSSPKDLTTMRNRMYLLAQYVVYNLTKDLPKEAFSQNGSTYILGLSDGAITQTTNNFGALVTNASKHYKNYLSNAQGQGLYTDEQYAEGLGELSNFLYAINPFYNDYMSAVDNNFTIEGNGMITDMAEGYLEEQLHTNLHGVSKDKTVDIKLNLNYKSKEGTITDLSTASIQNVQSEEGLNALYTFIHSFVEYFNPIDIELTYKQQVEPAYIETAINKAIARVVSNIPDAHLELSENSVDVYLDKYANMDKTYANSSDQINILITEDFYTILDKYLAHHDTGTLTEEEQLNEIYRYPDMEYVTRDGSFTVKAKFNEEESTNNLFVVDTTFVNAGEDTLDINLNNITLKSLLGSTYPANSATMLRSLDNTWDIDNLITEIQIEPNTFQTEKLYFVVLGDKGYMDMWMNDTQLGVIVNND